MNKPYLVFSADFWIMAIKNKCIDLGIEQVKAAEKRQDGYIGNANGVDCYITPKIPKYKTAKIKLSGNPG